MAEVDPGTLKIATGSLAVLFFAYSITVWLDKSVVAGDSKDSTKNSNYVVGIVYTLIALLLAYYTFF